MVDAEPVSDFQVHFTTGVEISEGAGYHINGKPSAFRPIGYPAFLGLLFFLFGPNVFLAKLANVFLYIGILALSYFVAKKLYKSELVARLTILILAFHPNHIAYTSLLATEILFLFLLMLAIALVLLEKREPYGSFVAGVVFGLACLVKPQAVFVPAVLLGPLFLRQFNKKQCIRVAVIYAGLFATVLPWSIRNYRVYGHFVFVSANDGAPLLVGNHPYATGGYVWNEYIVSIIRQEPEEYARNRIARRHALDYMLAHPFRTIKLWPAKVWYLWKSDTEGIYWTGRGLGARKNSGPNLCFLMRQVATHYHWLIGGLAFLGVIVTFHRTREADKEHSPLAFLGILLIGYYTCIAIIFFADPRYHFHLIPWVVMYAAIFLEEGRIPRLAPGKFHKRWDEIAGATSAISGKRVAFWVALFMIYLVGVFPRLRAAGYDEPNATNAAESMILDQAEALLHRPEGAVSDLFSASATARFFALTYRPYYWLLKGRYEWTSIDDVQFWRVRRYWQMLSILIGGLVIILIGAIGAAAFSRTVGLIAAAFCATSLRCTLWFCSAKEEALVAAACGIVVYCAYRALRSGSTLRLWAALAGIASGTAVGFAHYAAVIVPAFLLSIPFAPIQLPSGPRTVTGWRLRSRVAALVLYLLLFIGTYVLWNPHVVLADGSVSQSMSALERLGISRLLPQQVPPIRSILSEAGRTWTEVFYERNVADGQPFWMSLLLWVILIVSPVYAFVRRRYFVLILSVLLWLTYFTLWYKKTSWGYLTHEHFAPALVPLFLFLGYVLNWLCEALTGGGSQQTPSQRRTVRAVLLLLLCLWPLVNSMEYSLRLLDTIRGDSKARTERREIVHRLPLGSRVFLTRFWPKPHISDALFENVYTPHLYVGLDKTHGLDDVVREEWEYACIWEYQLEPSTQSPPYLKELLSRNVQPTYKLPHVSRWLNGFAYLPVQPGNGSCFNCGLYFREPCGGDYAGVRGVVPDPPGRTNAQTMHRLILKARLSNEQKWYPKFLRWEILLDGRSIWQRSATTTTKRLELSLAFGARAGSEILIRTIRTDHLPKATWGWGGKLSDLKISGLKLIDAASSRPIRIDWEYVGENGGPEPEYAMRRDWLNNESPATLLDMGFEGEQPLAEAWRSYRMIEPKPYEEFPKHWICREMSRVEKAPGLGLDGSDALRFIVGYPARGSATLGIMQPIAYPASRQVRKIRVHYRTDGATRRRGKVDLRLLARAVSLSGEYIDRAETSATVKHDPDRWETVELDVEGTWKRKHTRIDLIEFLEVSVEFVGGPRAVYNCLTDNIELE